MSGRSAYVRKEKTKVKEGGPVSSDVQSDKAPSLREFPMPVGHGYSQELPFRSPELATVKTHFSNGSDDMAYARVRKPVVPPLEVSGIEKSSFRSLMDKKSEGARKTLANAFGRKKKKTTENDNRPTTSSNIRDAPLELDTGEYTYASSSVTSPISASSRLQQGDNHDFTMRSPPPTHQLPAVPSHPPVKQWSGGRKAPQSWARLKRDPELWDDHGDVLVYLLEHSESTRPRPTFRLSSHLIEGLRIPSMNRMLSNNVVANSRLSMDTEERNNGFGHSYPTQAGDRRQGASIPDTDSYGPDISYELTFIPPGSYGNTKHDTLKYQLTVRNFFAMAAGASLVGLSFASALTDLLDWMETTMPDVRDASLPILNWLTQRELVDLRENPSVAAGLLTFYGSEGVRNKEGYLTAFCHCVGMLPRCIASPEYRHIPGHTRGMLEMAHLSFDVKLDTCQSRLKEFDFKEMWPQMTGPNPPSRQACERLRNFILTYYRNLYGSWPPPLASGAEKWLSRRVTQHLQKDFGALWDYLVNRDVCFQGKEEQAGRKWHLKWPGKPGYEFDTSDLPLQDILVAFDIKNGYTFNVGPYPLTPESINIEEQKNKSNQVSGKSIVDKALERKYTLAYAKATNLYILGDRYVENDFVEAFNNFERTDMVGQVDPFAARRGRWVLIYGILQTLASISPDTPGCEFTEGVSYYLGPSLQGCPPWRGALKDYEEAHHNNSYCWRNAKTWKEEPLTDRLRPTGPSTAPSVAPSFAMSTVPPSSSRSSAAMSSSSSETDYTNSLRSPSLNFASPKVSRHNKREVRGGPLSYSGYAPGIEKLDEEGVHWPIREGSVGQFGSDAGEGSQHGSERRAGSSTDLRRDAHPQELRNEAYANQRGFSRQQDFRPSSRSQTFSRQQSTQSFPRDETSPVRRPEGHQQYRRQESALDYRPQETSPEFRHQEPDQLFSRTDSKQGSRHLLSYDDASDDFYDGIRDFDDYRL